MGRFHPLSSLKSRQVYDPAGEYVGRVRDALVDLRDGRIEYVCIAIDDSGQDGRVEAVVPWSALEVDADEGEPCRVSAGKSVLERIAVPVMRR